MLGLVSGFPATLEIELTDARVPVETAVYRLVFVHVPESHAIGRINRGHAIIAPAVCARLIARAAEHGGFALAEVIRRVANKTSCITNTRQLG